jgi:hypothetical protein
MCLDYTSDDDSDDSWGEVDGAVGYSSIKRPQRAAHAASPADRPNPTDVSYLTDPSDPLESTDANSMDESSDSVYGDEGADMARRRAISRLLDRVEVRCTAVGLDEEATAVLLGNAAVQLQVCI